MGFDYKKFRNQGRIKKLFPFSSEKKMMATCYKDNKKQFKMFVKGVPDLIIRACTHFIG